MYAREEVKRIKEEFWVSFGKFLSPIRSADNEKIHWVNYKTGVKHLYFRMDATNKSASIRIEIAHPDEGIRLLMFSQFEEYKKLLHDLLQEEWDWTEAAMDDYGKEISCIGMHIADVSIFKKEDWPQIISFLKPRIIALDEFWSTAKYTFDIFK